MKRCLAFFLFFTLVTNSSFAKCEIGNCNDCTTLKSRCACVAMTYFQYKPIRHHDYTGDNKYETVRLTGCEENAQGILLVDSGNTTNNGEKIFNCTFKYKRYRSCNYAATSCEHDDKVISVKFQMANLTEWIGITKIDHSKDDYAQERTPMDYDCNPSKSDGKKWNDYSLQAGINSIYNAICLDRCTTDTNGGSPGPEDNRYPLENNKLWCMVYGDLYKVAANGKNVLSYNSADNISAKNASYMPYCTNEDLAKFIDPEPVLLGQKLDSVNGTGIDKSVVSSINTDVSMPFMTGSGNQSCDAGNVYTDGQCTPCNSKTAWVNYANENRMYCPGIKDVSVVGLQVKDQIKKCPKGMWPNSDLSDCDCAYGLTKRNGKCIGSLRYEDMYYGPEGKNTPLFKQCWTKVSEKAYKKCMGFDN